MPVDKLRTAPALRAPELRSLATRWLTSRAEPRRCSSDACGAMPIRFPQRPSLTATRRTYRGDATAIVDRGALLEVARFAARRSGAALRLAVDLTAVDYLGQEPRFEVVYHLYSPTHHHRLRLKARVPRRATRRIASVTPLWVGANWLERETYDMYGIRFAGHPDLRRIYLYEEFEGHPLRKDYPKEKRQPLIGPGATQRSAVTSIRYRRTCRRRGTITRACSAPSLMRVQLGPSHPATHGTVRIIVELDGEPIVDADVQVGYLHRGFEKECESGFYYQAIPYTDRLNYSSAILSNVGYCLAVEKLFGIETPPRCQFLRIIGGELSRMADHLPCIGATALELDAMTPFLYGFEARELVWDLIDALCGARVTSNYVRIGGVQQRLCPRLRRRSPRRSSRRSMKLLGDVENLLTENPIFRDRMEGTGMLPAERADRATASPVRCCAPPASLSTCAGRSPTWSTTSSTSTFRSARTATTSIATWCASRRSGRACASSSSACDMLPDGPVDVDDPAVRWPAKGRVFNRMEELIEQFKLVTEGPKPPPGEVYVGDRVGERRARLLPRERRHRQAVQVPRAHAELLEHAAAGRA